jgi:2,4-dienoyl-CoA reductase-like NADH-dependent reductase (Old Yellow Enzyme family)
MFEKGLRLIKFESLFSSFRLKNLDLKNRIVFLPHYTALASMDSLPHERETYYYGERAKGGAGLVISGNYAVSNTGQMHRTFIDASNEKVIPNFTKTTNLVHKYAGKIIGQITHSGPTKMEKPQSDLWAPSQVIEGSSRNHTVEIDYREMKQVIESFKKSTVNLLKSGFDGIEVKVAHDGLLRAFVSNHYNKRNDKYGGVFKNRMRYVREVFYSIKEIIGSEMPLGVRLCVDEFEDDGYRLEEGIEIAKFLEEKQLIDYVNTDAGTTWKSYIIQNPPMSFPLGFAEYMSFALKKEINLPVIAFGRINDPVQAEQMLQNGSADLIGMARQLICDPQTPKKAQKGDIDHIRKCIGCMDGCVGQVVLYQPIRCIQNPAVGKEQSLGIGKLKKSNITKKIVVVGGGAAGLKFSEIASKRGHNIILFEKEDKVGGLINFVSKIPFRNEFSEVIRYLDYETKSRKNISIRLSSEADEEKILQETPDIVVIATGSRPYIGKKFQDEKTCTILDILGDKVKVGRKVIIYDKIGKAEGIGLAEYLCEYYKDIEIQFFTPVNHAGEDVQQLNLAILYRKLFSNNFTVNSHFELLEVKNKNAVFQNVYSQKIFEVKGYDNLVCVGDSSSEDKLYKSLQSNGKIEVYRIGDCMAPRLVEIAIRHAEELARNI